MSFGREQCVFFTGLMRLLIHFILCIRVKRSNFAAKLLNANYMNMAQQNEGDDRRSWLSDHWEDVALYVLTVGVALTIGFIVISFFE